MFVRKIQLTPIETALKISTLVQTTAPPTVSPISLGCERLMRHYHMMRKALELHQIPVDKPGTGGHSRRLGEELGDLLGRYVHAAQQLLALAQSLDNAKVGVLQRGSGARRRWPRPRRYPRKPCRCRPSSSSPTCCCHSPRSCSSYSSAGCCENCRGECPRPHAAGLGRVNLETCVRL